MNKSHFFDLLKHPEELDKETLQSLTEIVAEYPWFQGARMLMVKNLHVLDHVRYDSELKLAAAYVADRARLYDLIHNQAAVKPVEEPATEMSTSGQKGEEPVKKVAAKEEKEASVPGDEEETDKQMPASRSSVEVSTNVKSISDYFQASDVYQTSEGTSLDFSFPSIKRGEDKEQPTTNALDYERQENTGYQLSEGITYHQVSDESRSFSDWLNMLQQAPIVEEEKKEEKPVKKRSQQIIDNFLNIERPRIVPVVKKEHRPSSISEQVESATSESDDLMSETLAGIYIKQKHYDKAISIFEKLRLKYPEKNVYFANRISELEKLINHQ